MAEDYFMGLAGKLVESARTTIESVLFNAINMVPNFIAALIVIFVGWGAASLFAGITRRILTTIKFEEYLEAHGLEDALGKVQITTIATQIVKYFVWFVFLQQAIALVSLGEISAFLGEALKVAPFVIGAIALVVAAAVFGEWVREKCLEAGKEPYLKTVGQMAKYFIIFLAIVSALDTLRFDTSIIKQVVVNVIQGVSLAFALTVGISFGLAGQDTAKDMLKSFRKVFHF